MKFRNIQALRGVAAIMVFLIHLLSVKHGLGADWFLFKYWWVGPAGVDLFFVISGFIVCYTAAKAGREDVPSYEAAGKFAIKRAFRVYPVYWVVLAICFIVAPYVQTADPSIPAQRVWRLVTLTTTNNNRVMLAWTLCYELFFYLVLTLIIFFRPKKVYETVMYWIVIQLGLSAWASAYGTDMFRYLPLSPLILEFGAGCIIAYMVDRGVRASGFQALFGGIVLFGVAAWAHSWQGNWAPWWRTLYFTVPCALIVYGAIAIEMKQGFSVPNWTQPLGDASYSLYIWHQLVFALLLLGTEKLGLIGRIDGILLMAIWGVICLSCGFASYYALERPLQNWVHRMLSKPKSETVASAAA